MYEGNADIIALLLISEKLNTTLRDREGFTAWDLLEFTLDTQSPLYTWRTEQNGQLLTWYLSLFS